MIITFCGTSLNHEMARSIRDTVCCPPARMGDIARAVSKGADAIVLIDGVFEDCPAVWHKEILWAMQKGIAVMGSSSIGALRAAELQSFGMIGHGRIYDYFNDGVLQDDDEVAVSSCPAELGFAPLSDALVDIRENLWAACDAGVITDQHAYMIVAAAKQIFFKERKLESIIQTCMENGLSPAAGTAVLAWLRTNKFSQKHRDAISLLQCVPKYLDLHTTKTEAVPLCVETVYMRRLFSFGYVRPLERLTQEN